MKIVLQRVKRASVEFQHETEAKIGPGMCLFVGVEKGDSEEVAQYLAQKIVELRIFPDEEGKMNRSLLDVQGELLAVSQFTLAGSLQKGRRPSFDNAESPGKAEELFLYFVGLIKQRGVKVETGVFGALMEIDLVNDGPVTFVLEKKQ